LRSATSARPRFIPVMELFSSGQLLFLLFSGNFIGENLTKYSFFRNIIGKFNVI
jgi:hypothetical protein